MITQGRHDALYGKRPPCWRYKRKHARYSGAAEILCGDDLSGLADDAGIFHDGGFEDRLAEIDAAIKAKQSELLMAGKDETKTTQIGEEIICLRAERQNTMTEAALKHDLKDRLDDLAAFLDEQLEAITENAS